MIDTILFALRFIALVAAITYFVTESGLMVKPRMLAAATSDWVLGLIYCRMCTSFWVGCWLGALGAYPLAVSQFALFNAIEAGFVAMGFMWLIQGSMPTHPSFEAEDAAIEQLREAAKARNAERDAAKAAEQGAPE